MRQYCVIVTVVTKYHLDIDAESEQDAISQARDLKPVDVLRWSSDVPESAVDAVQVIASREVSDA